MSRWVPSIPTFQCVTVYKALLKPFSAASFTAANDIGGPIGPILRWEKARPRKAKCKPRVQQLVHNRATPSPAFLPSQRPLPVPLAKREGHQREGHSPAGKWPQDTTSTGDTKGQGWGWSQTVQAPFEPFQGEMPQCQSPGDTATSWLASELGDLWTLRHEDAPSMSGCSRQARASHSYSPLSPSLPGQLQAVRWGGGSDNCTTLTGPADATLKASIGTWESHGLCSLNSSLPLTNWAILD